MAAGIVLRGSTPATPTSCVQKLALNYLAVGEQLQARGDVTGAVEQYRKALAIDPRCCAAWNALGNVFASLKDWSTAQLFFEEALKFNPEAAEVRNNLANVFVQSGQVESGVAMYRASVALNSNNAGTLLNLGNALRAAGHIEEARTTLESALHLRSHYPEAQASLGYLFHEQGEFQLAEQCYSQALRDDPDLALAHTSLSYLLLRQGDFARGLAEHEWRWRWPDFTSPRRNFTQSQWAGEAVSGKTVLLHAEQGLGDTIQFVRYAPLVAAAGAHVILEVQPELFSLMQTVPGVSQVVSRGDPVPAFDLHCPLLSLPAAFGTRLSAIPDRVPYLHARIQAPAWIIPENKLKAGLVWAGNPANQVDAKRSIPFDLLKPLLTCEGVAFYSFQRGQRSIDSTANCPFRGVLPASAEFGETAAAIMHMDLIIAADTAVAHLAGALGKPVWMLLPKVADWRWLENRTDSPWYPTARLFRQSSVGDWQPVINEVRQQVFALISQGRWADR